MTMHFPHMTFCSLLLLNATVALADDRPAVDRPNVLFIAVDDLNDWIGCLGRHPQALTPNYDRMSGSGVLFTGAYCAGASCNPSRSAVMTSIAPHRSGLYSNRQPMRNRIVSRHSTDDL